MDALAPDGQPGIEEVLECLLDVVASFEVLAVQVALEVGEKVEIRRGQVWGVWSVWKHGPTVRQQLGLGRSCNVRSRVVVLEVDMGPPPLRILVICLQILVIDECRRRRLLLYLHGSAASPNPAPSGVSHGLRLRWNSCPTQTSNPTSALYF